MKLFIGADHGGYKLKQQLIPYLEKKYEVVDLGAFQLDLHDDYPDIAIEVANMVAKNKKSYGILICRNGVGVCITANKIDGIRAALGSSVKIARSSRKHDKTNVLCLSGEFTSAPEAKKIVTAWINESFDSQTRRIRRIKKISRLEKVA